MAKQGDLKPKLSLNGIQRVCVCVFACGKV